MKVVDVLRAIDERQGFIEDVITDVTDQEIEYCLLNAHLCFSILRKDVAKFDPDQDIDDMAERDREKAGEVFEWIKMVDDAKKDIAVEEATRRQTGDFGPSQN